MAYDVVEVSRHIINYSDEKGYGIDNLKLQKLLYFVQADFLISENRPCFNEDIEAWNFGPVVPEAYHAFKHFGSSNIPKIKSYIKYEGNNVWSPRHVIFTDDTISQKDKNRIDSVVDTFSKYSSTYLVWVTHNQSPWKDAYIQGRNIVIPQESIKEYFKNE